MASTTVRISDDARDTLRRLAEATGEPMSRVLERSVRSFHEHWLLEEANKAFERMDEDPEERSAYDADVDVVSGTLMDGLENEPVYRARSRSRADHGR